MRTALIVVCLLLMTVAYMAFKCCHNRRIVPSASANIARLMLANGSFMDMALTSGVATCAAPLVCYAHTNGQSTIRAYPKVFCWQSGPHTTMLLTASAGMFVPLVFIAFCYWAVRHLPERARCGDTGFSEP